MWQLTDPRTHASAVETAYVYSMPVRARDDFTVRHDRCANVWVVEGGRDRQRWAFDDRSLAHRALRVTDLSASAGPPWGWIACAWAGILVGLCLLRRSAEPPHTPWARWRDGWHVGGGVVRLGPEGIAHVAGYHPLRVGPVALPPAGEVPAAGYRDNGLAFRRRAIEGTVADLVAAEQARSVAPVVLALAVVLDTSAALVAAWLAGLVG